MQSRLSSFSVIVIIIIVGLLAYFLGKKSASKTIDSIAMNQLLIQQIAELSSLEVRGNTSIKSTNITNDGSLSDTFKKFFNERTLNITVPFIAKYGIDLSQQNIHIEEKNKKVYIVLPEPEMLSYELRMDKADAISKKGILETSNKEAYNTVMHKLYTQSREQMASNTTYMEQSKEKIRSIIADYYQPMNFEVDIKFSSELKSKVLEPERQ